MESKCLACGSNAVSFRWTNLFLNGNSLIEVNFSNYCLRCGNTRMKTLREIHKEDPKKIFLYLLPEEKV